MTTFRNSKAAQKWVNENAWGEVTILLGGDWMNGPRTIYPQHYFGELTLAAHRSLAA